TGIGVVRFVGSTSTCSGRLYGRFGARRNPRGVVVVWLRGERFGTLASVAVQRQRVDRECEPDEVQQLADVSDAVSAAEPHCVVEVTVDGLGVVASREEPFEVGIAGRDGAKVLGAVELARGVLVVAVQSHGDDLMFVASGEAIVVIEAVPAALVLV